MWMEYGLCSPLMRHFPFEFNTSEFSSGFLPSITTTSPWAHVRFYSFGSNVSLRVGDRNVQLQTAQLLVSHDVDLLGPDNNVRLVQCGICHLWHNNAKYTHMILTIRLLRYFSTSDKLRTDTLALGIIILLLRTAGSRWFFSSGPGLVYNSSLISSPCLAPLFPLLASHTLQHTLATLFNIQKLCTPKLRLFLSAGSLIEEELLTLSTRAFKRDEMSL